MAVSAYGTDQYAWHPTDTTTFANQAQNLAKQAPDAGINQGQINVEKTTAQAEQNAGQTGQNVAAGASAVAQGNQASPTIAAPTGALPSKGTSSNPASPGAGVPTSGIAQPGSSQAPLAGSTSQYTITQEAAAAPDTTVSNNTDFSDQSNFQDPTNAYLQSLFPNGVPDSVVSALQQSLQGNYTQQDQQLSDLKNAMGGLAPPQLNNISGAGGNFSDLFNQYLEDAQDQINNPTSQDVQSYTNYLNNSLGDQQQKVNQEYQKGTNDINQQLNDKQQAISDYIDNLNKGLSDYQKNTSDLSNIGNLSNAEKNAQQLNSFLAAPTTNSTLAAQALNQNVGNSKLAALSGQAQIAAIQKAIGNASVAQQLDKSGQQALAAGQQAQAKGYTDANNAIQTNQTDTLNKLKDNGTAANKALTDLYNTTNTNLSKQEQDYVNKAQDTLKGAKIPEGTIKDAVTTFANSVQSFMNSNKLSDSQKANLKGQLESIWRIAVGTNPSDMAFSNQIASILNPIAGSVNS